MTFADMFPSEPDEKMGGNEWWSLHIVPVHSVCKVDLSGNALVFTPLNGEWVGEMLEKKALSLSRATVESGDDQILLTASPKELVSFLKLYGGDTNAFPADTSHHFKKADNAKPE